jgi:hypothetical protein
MCEAAPWSPYLNPLPRLLAGCFPGVVFDLSLQLLLHAAFSQLLLIVAR